MTNEDFVLIEKELDIILPERYKKIALEAPLKDTAYSDAFYNDPQKVIKTNLRLRKYGIYGSKPLRKNHLVVGFDGYYMYIDISSDEDVYYMANRTKKWCYTPDDNSHNSMLVALRGHIDTYLVFHESDMRRKNHCEMEYPTEKVNEILNSWREENISRQSKANESGEDKVKLSK